MGAWTGNEMKRPRVSIYGAILTVAFFAPTCIFVLAAADLVRPVVVNAIEVNSRISDSYQTQALASLVVALISAILIAASWVVSRKSASFLEPMRPSPAVETVTSDLQEPAWIFVSHSSADLENVRVVRNYLEARGAAPLLFHLKALGSPEEFWPLIEREIVARNFFLYCESNAAEQSEWVKRERDAVSLAAQKSPKRIGRIRVDGQKVETSTLDRFLASTRIFPSYSGQDRGVVEPFLAALREAGFQVFDDRTDLNQEGNYSEQIDREIELAAKLGWIVIFVSRNWLKSTYGRAEFSSALDAGARIHFVMLDNVNLPAWFPSVPAIDATGDADEASVRLVETLLVD